jgi:hypothetical protein
LLLSFRFRRKEERGALASEERKEDDGVKVSMNEGVDLVLTHNECE